jgi:hypothetical protein
LSLPATAARHDAEPAAPRQLIDAEVTIEGDDPHQTLALGDAHEGGIRKVHELIAILSHQRLDTRHVLGAQVEHDENSVVNHVAQGFSPARIVREQVHGLGESRPDGREGFANRLQRLDTPLVLVVVLVEQGDESAGVNERGAHGAVTVLEDGEYSIWTTAAADGSLTRRAEASLDPVWSPDGLQLAFTSLREGMNLAVMPSDGSGPPRPILVDAAHKVPTSWTPDGRFVLFTQTEPAGSTGEDVCIAAADGTGARPLADSRDNESGAVVSPDGQWFAYSAGAHTRAEIYVAALANPARRSRVETEDGYNPVWSRDGDELFFLMGTGRFQLAARQGPLPPGIALLVIVLPLR